MSELTSCNYCTLKGIRERAKENGLKVTLLIDNWFDGHPSGTSVYVHPKDVKIVDKKARKKYFKAWLMEIPNKCCC